MIAPNVILIWTGTVATIPDGYSRVTSMDGKFPKAWGSVVPNTTGGNATHTHTSPTHTHTISNHSHTGSMDDAYHENNSNTDFEESDSNLRDGWHHHDYSVSTVNSSSTSGSAVTYSAQSNNPPYVEVIFIKADGWAAIPDGATILLNSTTIPNGFNRHNGVDATPDLRNKYLRGAGTGQNAGATGGSYTNTHTIAHTHTTYHTHYVLSGWQSHTSGPPYPGDGGDNQDGCGQHRHYVTLNTATLTSGSNSSIGSQPETVQPAYKKIEAIKNTSGNNKLPQPGMVALWLGATADIPVGWTLCNGQNGTLDMRNQHLKIANDETELGDTGGSNTHTHAAESHTHSIPSHYHTISVGAATDEYHGRGKGGAVARRYFAHVGSHGSQNSSSTSSSTNASNTTANSSNNEPEYRTMAFIQFQFFAGGSPLLSLL